MRWEEYQKKNERTEKGSILLALIAIIIGAICDLCVLKGHVLLEVNHLDNVSLTILQIQATITTLTIAVVALLSGSIADSYMGIPVSKFYLEIRPRFLSQKRLIFVEFSGLLLGVVAHLFEAYNIVISVFVCAVIFIVLSVLSILAIFNGKRYMEEEIEAYISFRIENSIDINELGKGFTENLKSVAVEQSNEEFEKYMVIFGKIIHVHLEIKKIEDLNSMSESISRFLLIHESKDCKIKGLRVVNFFYDVIYKWICKHQEEATELLEQIQLMTRVQDEWVRAFESIEAEVLERNDSINVKKLSEQVIVVACSIGYNTEQFPVEIQVIYGIVGTVGRYLEKQTRKGNFVNNKKWQLLIEDSHGCFLTRSVPHNAVNCYMMAWAVRDFCFVRGFLLAGQIEMVKNGFFLDGLGNLRKIETKADVLKVMLVHCFMYYLAFREGTECIDKELQEKIREMLTDQKVVKTVATFFSRTMAVSNAIDESFYGDMLEILEKAEQFPIHSNFKSMIMDGVVEEYYLYVSLLIGLRLRREDAQRLIEAQTYYYYLAEDRLDILRKCLNNMHCMFEPKELLGESAERKTEEMLSLFVSIVKDKYKQYLIKKATSEQILYEMEDKEIEIREKLQEKVGTAVKSFFSDLKAEISNIKCYPKIHVFNFQDDTEHVGDDEFDFYTTDTLARLSSWLTYVLVKDFNVKSINRDEEFSSDEQFRKYLEENDFGILVGDRYVFSANDFAYENYSKHETFLEEMDCRFAALANGGIAIKKGALSFTMEDIVVGINSVDIAKLNTQLDSETGLYKYSVQQGINLDFFEDELKKYLKDARKEVSIFVNVKIGVNADNVVVIVRNED